MSAPPRAAWGPANPQAGPFCEVCKNQAIYERTEIGESGDYYVRRAVCGDHLPTDGSSWFQIDRTGLRGTVR